MTTPLYRVTNGAALEVCWKFPESFLKVFHPLYRIVLFQRKMLILFVYIRYLWLLRLFLFLQRVVLMEENETFFQLVVSQLISSVMEYGVALWYE